MRRCGILAGCFAALALLPASAGASTTFGSDLSAEPGGSYGFPATFVLTGVRTGSGGVAASPVDGVVVGWRLKYTPWGEISTEIALRVARSEGTRFRALGKSAPVTLPASSNSATVISELFPARLRIARGDFVGIEQFAEWGPIMFRGGEVGASVTIFGPPFAEGELADPSSTERDAEALLQAVVEPDADKDGWGDESQDNCPSAANPTQADTDADSTADACDDDDDNDGAPDVRDGYPLDPQRSVAPPLLEGPSRLGTVRPSRSGAVSLKRVTATCPPTAPAPCVVRVDVRSQRAMPRIIRFGRVTRKVAPGVSFKLRVGLSSRGLKALRRLGSVNAVALVDGASQQATSRKRVRLKLRARGAR